MFPSDSFPSMFIGFNLRNHIDCWKWLILKSVSQALIAREASACAVDGAVHVSVCFWQTGGVPRHAQSLYSAAVLWLVAARLVISRSNLERGYEFVPRALYKVFTKRLTTSLPFLREKCSDWVWFNAVIHICFIVANLYKVCIVHYMFRLSNVIFILSAGN